MFKCKNTEVQVRYHLLLLHYWLLLEDSSPKRNKDTVLKKQKQNRNGCRGRKGDIHYIPSVKFM